MLKTKKNNYFLQIQFILVSTSVYYFRISIHIVFNVYRFYRFSIFIKLKLNHIKYDTF